MLTSCRDVPRALVAITAAALVTATTAGAGEPQTHDGFFLRLSGGGGYAESSVNSPIGDVKLSGATGDFNLAIGGVVSPNLAVHGTIWGWTASDPDVEIGSASGSASGASLTMSAFGAGITYYFVPINMYISPSLGFGTLSVEEDNVSASTDTGFALDATLGKEWWVSGGWGIGVAGAFSYHVIPDGAISEDWGGPGFGLRFTATMN